MERVFRSLTGAVALALLTLATLESPVAAHVTVNPPELPKGSFGKVTFRMPNERDAASTTKLEVTFPEGHGIANVSVRPTPGWTHTVQRAGDAVSGITWTGGPVRPGEFQEFDVSLGPLPDDKDRLVFKALQTYDNGEVVRWIEEVAEGQDEPEHPAPTLILTDPVDDDAAAETPDPTAANDDGDGDDDDGGPARIAFVLSIVAMAIAVTALTRARRSGS